MTDEGFTSRRTPRSRRAQGRWPKLATEKEEEVADGEHPQEPQQDDEAAKQQDPQAIQAIQRNAEERHGRFLAIPAQAAGATKAPILVEWSTETIRRWQRHLRGQNNLRVVYIPQWFMASFQDVLNELRLAFSRDPEILSVLEACTTPADVKQQLRAVTDDINPNKLEVVIVLDQVYDSPKSGNAILDYDEFFFGVANVITASSPRFL